MNWRLICPTCERRTFHDEEGDGPDPVVSCRACGDSAPLPVRKSDSRKEDPNPDRYQQKMGRWSE